MPQYLLGHREKTNHIQELTARHPALFLTGSAYRGVGLPDCIDHATEQARNVAAFCGKI
jgi:oxygen-dependent protoporphyrinogen oxidase